MKKFHLLFAFLFLAAIANGQKTIDTNRVKAHIETIRKGDVSPADYHFSSQ